MYTPLCVCIFAFWCTVSFAFDEAELLKVDMANHPYLGNAFGSTRLHHAVKAMLSNKTYEVFQPQQASTVEFATFRTKKQTLGSAYVPILITTVPNPLQTFSIYPPKNIDGCEPGVDHRTEVSVSSKHYGCIAASNAGFFNVTDGSCFGNIVSDGKVIQNTGLQNANFGVRQDGSIVVGYLSHEDVANQANPFVNLVAGVIWLVRDGRNYVSQSAHVEDMSRQTTGDAFVTVQSARAALGHDREGKIVLVQVDGKSWERGISLDELADFMVSMGVVNAINLDGGGSMTAVGNNILVSTPSDYCDPSPFDFQTFCERKVTSLVCLHYPRESYLPTPAPTPQPLTSAPTPQPTPQPTAEPSAQPSNSPTQQTRVPTACPTPVPSPPTASKDLEVTQFWYLSAITVGLLIGYILLLVFIGVYFKNFIQAAGGNNYGQSVSSHIDEELDNSLSSTSLSITNSDEGSF